MPLFAEQNKFAGRFINERKANFCIRIDSLYLVIEIIEQKMFPFSIHLLTTNREVKRYDVLYITFRPMADRYICMKTF